MKITDYFNSTRDIPVSKNNITNKPRHPIQDNYQEPIRVYTDGSCVHNGTPRAKAGIGVYFTEFDPRNVSKRVVGKQTNNTAELKAILEVFHILEKEIREGVKVLIYTDSQYAMRCCKGYGAKMKGQGFQVKNKKNGHLEDIPNRLLVEKGYHLFLRHSNVQLVKVEAHTGRMDRDSLGNEGADRLANKALGRVLQTGLGDKKKIYVRCPFDKKDAIKPYGAKWDFKKKKWYYWSDLDPGKVVMINKILT